MYELEKIADKAAIGHMITIGYLRDKDAEYRKIKVYEDIYKSMLSAVNAGYHYRRLSELEKK